MFFNIFKINRALHYLFKTVDCVQNIDKPSKQTTFSNIQLGSTVRNVQ